MARHRRNRRQGPCYGSKISVPRHRKLGRASADALERSIERVERRDGRAQIEEELQGMEEERMADIEEERDDGPAES